MPTSPSSHRTPAAPPRRLARLPQALGLLLAAGLGLAQAELPVEQTRIEPLAPATPERIYLTDPVMPHLVDGRVIVIDGQKMKRLAVIGSGFSALTTLSPDRQWLYVATTYHSRLQRGTRTDVVEVYRTDDLTFSHEIEIPPKHAQGLPIKALMQTSADGRFLLIQNATPATSVTVVDTQARKVTAEIANPGCWGAIPWPQASTRFSTVCGDGTLQTFDLSATGTPAGSQRSARFFDPDKEPLFMHYSLQGSTMTMVGFYGAVQQITLEGDAPRFATPWNFIREADRKQGWRPSGFQLFEVVGGQLIVGMHPQGAEGTHKNPAEQLWTVDLTTRTRVARTPGFGTLSMTQTREAQPKLVLLSALDNTLRVLDPAKPATMGKPLRHSEPMGETPVYLETH
ncbi:amine dehydrogenase large subunit [Ideonella livida]|uniref:Amine dehydrogenase n=1 Tax=Ideonella livida TaxID=2707176 RepID=A0A7C9TIH4_9BURK|nr:amine dehydrogenase large subunit [Ideonella livida]NDY91240.1 amine dehydrogenase [Ideonella livida]